MLFIAPCGTIVPGTSPTRPRDKWDKIAIVINGTAGLSQGLKLVCPRDGVRLSQEPFLFIPDTVPPKMFIFICFLGGTCTPTPPPRIPWSQKIEPKHFFFSNFSGASRISRQNPGISRPKSLIPCVSRDIPNFFGPHTPSCGRPPPHQKIILTQKFRFVFFFLCLNTFSHRPQTERKTRSIRNVQQVLLAQLS